MVRSTPPSDWVVYLVVLGVTAATLYGKHLIAKGDEPISQAIKEDIDEVEQVAKEVEDKIIEEEKEIEQKIKETIK